MEQLKTQLTTAGGTVDKVDKWGKRRLAYRVDKYREGSYVLFQFTGGPETVKEFERRLRVSDLVLKFLTVRIDETLKRLDKRKKERDKRAAKRAAQAPATPAPAQPSLEQQMTGSDRRTGDARPAGRRRLSDGGIQEEDAGSAVAAPHRRRQGGRHAEEAIFPAQEGCRFCVEKIDDINYKDMKLLHAFVAERGKIVPRRISGVCAPHQRRLTDAIKKARNIALLPFAASF